MAHRPIRTPCWQEKAIYSESKNARHSAANAIVNGISRTNGRSNRLPNTLATLIPQASAMISQPASRGDVTKGRCSIAAIPCRFRCLLYISGLGTEIPTHATRIPTSHVHRAGMRDGFGLCPDPIIVETIAIIRSQVGEGIYYWGFFLVHFQS